MCTEFSNLIFVKEYDLEEGNSPSVAPEGEGGVAGRSRSNNVLGDA